MKSRMRRGENIALIPGGFQEATMFEYNRHTVYIKRRKVRALAFASTPQPAGRMRVPLCADPAPLAQGFIKYALQHGYRVYPCYTFGEERTYYSISVLDCACGRGGPGMRGGGGG